ncbi:MAG: ATP-dependent protease ATPase subunit HslU [Microscillaceae bacterium]|nr:ATP-dependent protease ATPase subunit HslU [Microscillaceae bacterium]MDW8459860.1 ATP-dependent protease ATPase subunit HslU [Cytophagales bacterium]
MEKYLTPKQIVAELDKYIVGQAEAKRQVAIALRNRWRRLHSPADMKQEIMPNNILMIGATGVGKTEIARRLAKLADAPFVKVEASKFTEVGYVGRDVESMVRDLMEQAINMVKSQKREQVKQKALEMAEEIILDILIPAVTEKKSKTMLGFDNEEVIDEEYALNQRTREKFREKIRRGELDDRKIEIEIQQSPVHSVGIAGPGVDEVAIMNLQEMISGILPKKSRKRKMSIAEARKYLLEEEINKLIDMDEVKEEALKKAENAGIIFIDEIDKIASKNRGGSGGPDVSREGVQRDLLPIVEGSAVNTKYGVVNTEHILFIAAGAFHFAKPSDLIPELQGRFPIRVELQSLTKEDFYRILKEPKNSLTKQYTALLAAEGVTLSFNEDALLEIAEIAYQINTEIENIGARRLHTVMSHLLNQFMFEVPDVIPPNAHIVVTAELVRERLQELVKNKDLSQYIL